MKRQRLKLIDWRIASVAFLVGVFTVIPIVHVATFTGSFEPSGYEWLGYIYALGLDFGIAICAWFTRWKTTRITALVSYFIFVMVDGSFNVAYIEPWKKDNASAAWLYAIFPTLIVGILSILTAMAGKLSAKGNRVSLGDVLSVTIGKKFGFDVVDESQVKPSGNNGKVKESSEEILSRMSKQERIIYLSQESGMESQARIAQLASCSEGYVSKVLARLQDSEKHDTISHVTQAM